MPMFYFQRFPALIILILVALVSATLNQKVIRIGGAFPLTHSNDAGVNIETGSIRLASFILAINDLKAKYQNENITIKFSVRNCADTFTRGALAAIDLASKVFQAKGIHALVGVRKTIRQISESNIAQISYDSDSTLLSQYSDYPTHLRSDAPSSYEAHAIADMTVKTFLWRRVIVLYTADTYGEDALTIFQLRAADLGIDVITTVPVIPGAISTVTSQAKLSTLIEELKEFDARIFILLMDDIAQAQNFISLGYSIELFHQNTVIFGTSAITTPALWSSDILTFGSHIGIETAKQDWNTTPRGLAFQKRFEAQPATVTSVSGVRHCSNATDDDGSFPLYSIYTTSGTVCTGMNYSDAGPLGDAAYIYDSTIVLVESVILYCKQQYTINGDYSIPDYVSGKNLGVFLTSDFSTSGVTGDIRFSQGIEELGYFGHGDRDMGVRYKLVSYLSTNDSVSGIEMNRVGTWTSEGGYVPCFNDSTLQSSITGGCASLVWGTADNGIPSDRAPPIDQLMPEPVVNFLLTLAVILFVSFLCAAGVLVRYRDSRILKASQLTMLWLVLVSCVYAAVRIVTNTVDQRIPGICVAGSILDHLCYTGIIALFAKTLRIHMIVNSKLKKVRISTKKVLLFTVCLIGIQQLYMVVVTSVDVPYVKSTHSISDTGQYTYKYSCSTHYFSLRLVLTAYEFMILLSALKLCYDTRNVPDAVNEAPAIARIIFIDVIVIVSIYSVANLTYLEPWEMSLLTSLVVFVSFECLILLYFVPRAFLLVTGGDLNSQFEIVRSRSTDKYMKTKPEKKRKSIVVAFGLKVYPVVSSVKWQETSTSIQSRKVFLEAYCSNMPDTIGEAERVIRHYKAHVMQLTQEATDIL